MENMSPDKRVSVRAFLTAYSCDDSVTWTMVGANGDRKRGAKPDLLPAVVVPGSILTRIAGMTASKRMSFGSGHNNVSHPQIKRSFCDCSGTLKLRENKLKTLIKRSARY